MDSSNNSNLSPLDAEFKFSLARQVLMRGQRLVKNSFLVSQLVKVNIKRTYKRSFIGLSWMVITPIFSVIAWVLLHGAGIMSPGDTGIPYPAYVLLSTSIWAFFLGAYQSCSKVLMDGSRLIVTVHFPHEVLVLEKVVVHVINFIIPFMVNIVVLLLYGISFSWVSILFPLTLLPLLALGMSLGLVVALLRVVAVDLAQMVDRFMQLVMFITPVIYAPKVSMPGLATIVNFNPLTYLLGFSRELLTKGTFYEPTSYFIVSILSLLLLLLAFGIFTKFERKLAERMLSV